MSLPRDANVYGVTTGDALFLSEVVALIPVIAAAVVAIIIAWRRPPN